MTIIKFLTAGHVDDGKSTLIGKFLYDAKAIHKDQIDQVKKLNNGKIDYSLFVEGLEAERRQKITIDVAYRYFSYQDHKFIIADAPGHEEYTRNMAVAAANSDIAVILIDAIDGVKTQTIRHSFIAHLFGIKKFIIAINKMDLVDYNQNIFNKIKNDYLSKIKSLKIDDLDFVPISAVNGDNILKLSSKTNWYKKDSLFEKLLKAQNEADKSSSTRFAVQNVFKYQETRLYQGKLISGNLAINDFLEIYPTRQKTKVIDIIKASRTDLSLILEDDFEIDRGSFLVKDQINFENTITANLIWFSRKEFELKKASNFLLKISHKFVNAKISKINYLTNLETFGKFQSNNIWCNQIANVEILLSQKIAYDFFEDNKFSGSFLLIDPIDNETLAVGLTIKN